jgi:hypothetical protein
LCLFIKPDDFVLVTHHAIDPSAAVITNALYFIVLMKNSMKKKEKKEMSLFLFQIRQAGSLVYPNSIAWW